MAQHFKYNTGSTINNTTQKGNIAIATSGTYDWGPTSSTGYYPETTPPTGGYTIYYMRSTGGPSIEVATSDAQCVTFLKSFGATGTTINNVLTWVSNTADYYVQTGATPSYTIGQSALGGVVAYILQSGDTGYNASVQHGLVAATSDQSTGVKWWNGTVLTITTSDDLGTGLANTNAIISAQGAGTYAASISRNYTGGGYSDWYLPSTSELSELFNNKVAIGGFTNNNYWTSSELPPFLPGYAYGWDFSTDNPVGVQTSTNTFYVRAIRSF